ncbi:MAG: DNA polymerase III subunit alpha [Rhodospirillales bacterium]|nr:DNA polymerase III subunit alpha [Rhodospirillales bacterium]USO07788.1 MAG: DNA polymerase III subunit alpha [Rhodospirillales bacterium]
MAPGFVHLHVHTAYSLAEGAIPVKSLVKMCAGADMPAVAIADTNNLFGALEFAKEAAGAGVQPIIGVQMAIGFERHELTLLAQTPEGYKNLCRLVSRAYLESEATHGVNASWDELAACAGGVICLSGGVRGPVAQYLLHNQPRDAERMVKKLAGLFDGRFYIEIQRHGVREEQACEAGLVDLAYKHDIPLVATNDVYFADSDMHEAHDALLCIAGGRYVTEEDRRRVSPECYFKSAAEMRALFADLPEAVDNTLVIARRCSHLLKPIDPILPPFSLGDGRSEIEILEDEARTGLDWRLENYVLKPDMSDEERSLTISKYKERLQFEIDTIKPMGFAGYFLIVSDFIRWAKAHGIPVGPGRGSGAGSVVAWALRITDLDPLVFNLLFERFLNPERVSMPDFDVDFCQDRRDEVIRYVQDRYGHDRVAQIITFGKLQARAVVRDVGRVLQMPYGQVDRLAKMIPQNPANPISLEEALEADADLRVELRREETTAKLIDIALKLEGLYRHASTHAAGVVIGDRALEELVPLYRDPGGTMPATQFNMKFVESAGLVKFDFLGLKTMTVIQKAAELIGARRGTPLDILSIPLDDEKTLSLIARGETVGVFQLESAGMRDLGIKMKVSNFEQIIALVALFRPGPMENIPKYLACLHGQEEKDYMHPKLEPVLKDTYGVMIYQEQVMQAAQVLAGYSLGGADLLRRAMGKKIQSEMDAQREQFVKGAAAHSDVGPIQANAIFDRIDKFAGYGFNKAHSAGYALISYWTAWLKANHPLEFMAASMTLDQGNTDKLSVFRQECARMGIPVLPPDVNASSYEFSVEGRSIRYSLAALKGVGMQAMMDMTAERAQNGVYKDIFDFAERCDPKILNKKTMEALAVAGAFDGFGLSRAAAFEAAEVVLRYCQNMHADRDAGQIGLFGAGAGGVSANRPPLPDRGEWDHLEKLRHEFEAVGFYLSAHPLDAQRALLARMGVVLSSNLPARLQSVPHIKGTMAGVLLKKNEKVSAKTGNKYAFLQMSDSGGVFEGMMFSEELARTRSLLNAGESLLLQVDAEMREDRMRITVTGVRPLADALAGMPRKCMATMTDTAGLEQLKSILTGDGNGVSSLMLNVPANDGRRAEMVLPGRWKLSQGAMAAIRRVAGVSDLSEG